MPIKKRKREEAQLQAAIFKWLHRHPKFKKTKLIFAVPNGGSRNPIEAANLKRQGVTSGVSDIVCLIPSQTYHGFVMELKSGKNKPTSNQELFLAQAFSVGYAPYVCYTIDEAMDSFKQYFKDTIYD